VENLARAQDFRRFSGVFFLVARAPGKASLEDSAEVKKGVGKFCRAKIMSLPQIHNFV
jgi:hypothetical protein